MYSSVEAGENDNQLSHPEDNAPDSTAKTSSEIARCRDSVDDLDEEEDESNVVDVDEEKESSSPELMLAHANLITALIGICTFLLLWIPIPILHWTHIEVCVAIFYASHR